jgi:hypothetical protein
MRLTTVLFAILGLVASTVHAERGYFEVSARNPFGTTFTNSTDHTMTIAFFATGQWGYKSSGTVGPRGDTAQCRFFGNCPVGYAGVGALVVRQGPDFFFIGDAAEVTVKSGETVYFLFNDAETEFSDNNGSVNVQWFCTAGCAS